MFKGIVLHDEVTVAGPGASSPVRVLDSHQPCPVPCRPTPATGMTCPPHQMLHLLALGGRLGGGELGTRDYAHKLCSFRNRGPSSQMKKLRSMGSQ